MVIDSSALFAILSDHGWVETRDLPTDAELTGGD